MRTSAVSAVLLVALAGSTVLAVPTIDGIKTAGDDYGPAKWVNSVPTRFGDNVTGAGISAPGNPEAVTTGIELRVPKADIGYTGGPLKMMVMVNSGDSNFLSNQVLGGIPANTGNLGNAGGVNFETMVGTQTLSITPTTIAGPAVIDGTLDASFGTTPDAVQTCYTQFGNATHGNFVRPPTGSNGSELDNIYVREDAANLYIFIGGNLEANFNKLQLWFDTTNANTASSGFTGLPGALNNITFESTFAPDYMFHINGGGGSGQSATLFLDFWTASGAAFTQSFAGSTAWDATNTAALIAGGTGGMSTGQMMVNNSNTIGVPGSPVSSANAAPNADFAYGSEINAVYSKVEGGKLYIMITGNMESNFGKLPLFFSVDGIPGQNRLRGANDPFWPNYRGNVEIDFNGLTRMGAITRRPIPNTDPVQFEPVDPTDPVASGGLTFDADFEACYWIKYTNGGNPHQNYMDAVVIRAGGRNQTANGNSLDWGGTDGGTKGALGTANNPMTFSTNSPLRADIQDETAENVFCGVGPRLLSAAWDPFTLSFSPAPATFVGNVQGAFNNLNVAGVSGYSETNAADPVAEAAAAAAVTTGFELAIDLRELFGWDGVSAIPTIKLAGFVANGGYDFISNQVLGGIPTGGAGQQPGQADNLGESRNINFTTMPGTQYVIVYQGAGGPVACNSADIAATDGTPGADQCVNNGDFSLFFSTFFSADCSATCGILPVTACGPADIAATDGSAGADGCVDNGDFSLFFSEFFSAVCPDCAG